jgi:hypothetical protein
MLEITESLHNLWPLEWYSAPQSKLVMFVMDGFSQTVKYLFAFIYLRICLLFWLLDTILSSSQV